MAVLERSPKASLLLSCVSPVRCVEIQGEPWGWVKPGPKPKGWREDGDYGGQSRDDPGPYDGRWERPEEEEER